MSYRYEFIAEARDGRIELPAELAARGIDAGVIGRVAATQSFDGDVATVVLRGEGAAAGSALGERLLALMTDDGREHV